MKNLILTGLTLSFLTFSGCAGNTTKDAALDENHKNVATSPAEASKDSVSIEAKLAAAQQNTSDVTEVRFQKGSRTLSRGFIKKIDKALAAAAAKSPLSHVSVVVWSDLERNHQADDPALAEPSKKLANDRGEMIKALVDQKYAKLPVDIVNMSEKPGKIQKFLRTEDFRVQQELETAGEGTSKASHAIVIIETKQKQTKTD